MVKGKVTFNFKDYFHIPKYFIVKIIVFLIAKVSFVQTCISGDKRISQTTRCHHWNTEAKNFYSSNIQLQDINPDNYFVAAASSNKNEPALCDKKFKWSLFSSLESFRWLQPCFWLLFVLVGQKCVFCQKLSFIKLEHWE